MKVHSSFTRSPWLLVPFLFLINSIEITKAFASTSQNRRARSYVAGAFREERTLPFLRNKYQQHSRPLAVATDPMRSSITPNEDWRIASTSSGDREESSKRKGDSTMTEEETAEPKNVLNYFLEVTLASLKGTYENITPIIPGYRKKEQVVQLVDIDWLKTHEEVIHDRVTNLKHAILEWDEYRMPLLVDCKSGAILDGHHRYHVGRSLGLSRLPVVLVDYLEDDSIDVDVWPECGVECICKEDVIEMSLSDEVFPPKTSRHDFVSEMTPINIPLSDLF